ncbi:SDR family NAD(P)-dependent oxidoreductase, partial [Kitasatospora sp. NPDC092286]|uniref:type I polyketide synthase n=1 Tax=Kitasatospora sp. NPDC092286 TaxID=3364087 RepID=UPI00382E2677
DTLERLYTSAAQLHVSGVPVDWTATGTAGKPIDLPTYAFQHQRYWPQISPSRSGDVTSIGMTEADHPLLGAAVELAGSGELLFTGRLSVQAQPWLADHAVAGSVLLPGTGFVELAIRAGDEVGCGQVEELTLEAPLVLPERGAVSVQVSVGAGDESGRRELGLFSRPQDGATDDPWTRHATGVLAPATDQPAADPGLTTWPPTGAEPLAVEDAYDRLAELGVEYGPSFCGLRAAWLGDGEVFVEARLPERESVEARAYGLHPALFDVALQPLGLGTVLDAPEPGRSRRPFSWRDVQLWATGADALRIRVAKAGDESVSLTAADASGRLVATVGEVTLRQIAQEGASAQHSDALFQVDWLPVAAPVDGAVAASWAVLGEAGGSGVEAFTDLAGLARAVANGAPVPELVFAPFPESESGLETDGLPSDLPAAVRGATYRVLELLQGWLADERFEASRLVVVARRGLVGAPVWGLVRSAQVENPGRFVLLEDDRSLRTVDGSGPEDWAAMAEAVATGEPQLRLTGGGTGEGAVTAARLVRAAGQDATAEAAAAPVACSFDRPGTVLITGASGGLARLLARHLVVRHGATRLLLAGRRGAAAEGMPELLVELGELGAVAEAAACDVADREALAELLAGIPAAHPLVGVVHTAAVLEDGVLTGQSPERLDRVLRPKVDGALNLHELTARADLSAFVLYSSLSGMLGGAGLANYSAANAFLDALARHRHELGLPAASLAWGLWEQRSGMAGRLSEVDLVRMSRAGAAPMPAEEGLALFDAALALGEPVVVPARLDTVELRSQAAAGVMPALFRAVVRPGPVRRAQAVVAADPAVAEESLAERLAGLARLDQDRLLLDVVREHVNAVLGHTSADVVRADRAFKELGFDSLTAVELRNRLRAATGLRLAPTLVFDHPTPAALVELLRGGLVTNESEDDLSVLAELERFEAVLAQMGPDEGLRGKVAERLQSVLWKWDDARGADSNGELDAEFGEFDPVSDEEMFNLIDQEFGDI